MVFLIFEALPLRVRVCWISRISVASFAVVICLFLATLSKTHLQNIFLENLIFSRSQKAMIWQMLLWRVRLNRSVLAKHLFMEPNLKSISLNMVRVKRAFHIWQIFNFTLQHSRFLIPSRRARRASTATSRGSSFYLHQRNFPRRFR